MRSFGGSLLLAGIGVVQFVYMTPPVDNAAAAQAKYYLPSLVPLFL